MAAVIRVSLRSLASRWAMFRERSRWTNARYCKGASGDPGTAGARHARTTKALLGRHLKHIAVAGRLCRSGAVLDAGLGTSASDRGVFDDLVELGLADGRITPRLVRGLARELVGRARGNHRPPHQEGPS